jgi:hypothetical protein
VAQHDAGERLVGASTPRQFERLEIVATEVIVIEHDGNVAIAPAAVQFGSEFS